MTGNVPWDTLRRCLLAQQEAEVTRLLAANPPIDPRHRAMWRGRSLELQRARARRAVLAADGGERANG